MVIIQEESLNRNSWKLGIMKRLIVGRDGIVVELTYELGEESWNEQCSSCTLSRCPATEQMQG